ncbi:Crp/Fnr family transcriptional regulator [Sphaerotilus sp.]|jgi:CRP/FNR family transcriptional regulator, cyclic AMP receptor protein|uniref:Crp/Fnr family transcriptional regulator n=1 Tax=Sphaerotilus sp. TaxID=2093942 RepID=UPI0025DDC4AC|nr:Crp/Fnr family transcriptional regulator [Sphaerotilus sp.]
MPRSHRPPAAAEPSLDTLNLSPALLALVRKAVPRRYRKGVILIQEGEIGDTLYVVLAGRVKVFSLGPNDREITFGLYGCGEFIGEMSLDGGPRVASVVTVEPTTCVVITRQTLQEHLAQYPEFAFELLAKVIARARAATRDARNMALMDSYGRLVALIEELAVTQEDGTRRLVSRVTHAEIASRIGCSREMVSRLLKDLERGGYTATIGRGLHILKPLPNRW